MDVRLLKKYVDDVLVAVVNLPLGSRYCSNTNTITHRKEDEDEDSRNCQTKDQVTIKVLKDMANSVMTFLDFTAEVSRGPEHPVACLDTQIWFGYPGEQGEWFSGGLAADMEPPGKQWNKRMDRKTIMYKFYSKPMTNPLTILQRSAMPENIKIATISKEIL